MWCGQAPSRLEGRPYRSMRMGSFGPMTALGWKWRVMRRDELHWRDDMRRFIAREALLIRIPVRLPTQPSRDQTKPWRKGQEAPLPSEYQAILEASIADQAQGGVGNFPTTTGRAADMPHVMMGFIPMEFVVTPDTTYVLIGMIPSRGSHASFDWMTEVQR